MQNRRNFIKNTALITGGIIAVPTIIPSCVKGANDKITLAMKLQRKLQWDTGKEEFINDEEANAMRSREERDPWKVEKLIV